MSVFQHTAHKGSSSQNAVLLLDLCLGVCKSHVLFGYICGQAGDWAEFCTISQWTGPDKMMSL